jgi:hypothetical protein
MASLEAYLHDFAQDMVCLPHCWVLPPPLLLKAHPSGMTVRFHFEFVASWPSRQ